MMKTICVYCASSTKVNQRYYDAAVELGELMAQKGVCLVNGAGTMGLMRACADAVLNNGGKAVGIIPKFMIDRNWHYEDMTELVVTKNMHDRKKKMADMADGCIALPGGCGTLEELLEIIHAEIENAKDTIPLVEANSRLGYEKEYGYSCCKEQLLWKIQMAERTIAEELLPLLEKI